MIHVSLEKVCSVGQRFVSLLPRSVAVDVERPSHQNYNHGSDGFAFAVEVVVAQVLQLMFGDKQLLWSEGREVQSLTLVITGYKHLPNNTWHFRLVCEIKQKMNR